MSRTNAFSKNTKKEMRQGNFVSPVTSDLDDLLRVEREEGTEKTWQSIKEKLGKEMADEQRALYLRVWEILTKPPKPEWLSAEWYEKYKDKPFSWEGFDRSCGKAKQEGSMLPEEVEDSFQRLLHKKSTMADAQLIKDLPMIAPYQLGKRYLVDEGETSTEIIKKYQRQFGNETVTYTLLIPKEEYKKGHVPTFGDLFRKVLLIVDAFAYDQKTLSPVFRKEHIFRLQGKTDDKVKGVMYKRLDNVLKTLGYTIYEVENNKKGKEYRKRIGHITESIEWMGRGRGGSIKVTYNKEHHINLAALVEGEKGGYQVLSIPKDRLEKWSRDEDNFLNYIDGLAGLRESYPILIKTLFVKKLGYPMKTIRKMGSGEISNILNKCLETTRTTERLRKPYWEIDYRGDAAPKNILNWKIKLFLSREEQNT